MVMPIIIGLPGVGKSEVNRALAERLNCKIISTENEFRTLRAIGANDDHPEAVVINLFLKKVYEDFVVKGKMTPYKFARLMRACEIDKNDLTQKNSFHTDKVLYSFGMDVFRTFEAVVNKWLYDQGHFAGKLPDVSAFALANPDTRRIFSAQNDFVPVLLNADHERIVNNLMTGFDQYVELSLDAKQSVPVRDDYDQIGLKALYEAVEHVDETESDLYYAAMCAGATREYSLMAAWTEANSQARDVVRSAFSYHAMQHRMQCLPSLRAAAKMTIDMNDESGGQAAVTRAVDRIVRELNLG